MAWRCPAVARAHQWGAEWLEWRRTPVPDEGGRHLARVLDHDSAFGDVVFDVFQILVCILDATNSFCFASNLCGRLEEALTIFLK